MGGSFAFPKVGKVAPAGPDEDELAKKQSENGESPQGCPHIRPRAGPQAPPQGGKADNVNLRVGKKKGICRMNGDTLFCFAHR